MAFCKNCGKEIKKGEKCSCETETKFCKACGKKLVGDEICDCTESVSSSSDFDFVSTMKEIKDDLISLLKKPVTTIKDATDKNNMPKTYILIAILALTFGLFISSIFKPLSLYVGIGVAVLGGVSSTSLTSIGVNKALDYIKVPYIKVILFGAIIFAIMIAAYALIMLLVSAIFKNKKINYKQALTLTTTSYMPLIWSNVICAILGFLGLSIGLILVVYLVFNMIVIYNFIYAYAQYTKLEDNKFGYAIVVLVIVSSLIVGICTNVITNSITKSITNDITVDMDDLFD